MVKHFILSAAIAFACFPAVAQRSPDGHPDLQGTYDLATLTPLERPAGTKAVLTKEEAAKLEKDTAAQKDKANEAIKGDRPAPPKGGDGSTGAAGNVGGYNVFWLDPGSRYTVVDGQIRASIVVDPADGRVPIMIPAARKRMLAALARPTSDAPESKDPGLEPPAPTTIPNSAPWVNAACSDSPPPPDRPRCPIISTTISTRSCRRRTR